ncbi:galactokinase, putative [Cryptococcus deneoformans JEC21]|uniref:Galactokinase n=1 Tax=Cryptococcus deneoformans (strain JEC21 / ATCC MYA-565) TaxID=214684 RepID=Q5K808_CRYD1|nr:galactokinase, putative [Cryptococcus neoformans var. neoformans JEC21]AAW46834.1 galactokinase, putative [Cryptococcus neoformans var. neoformans JEC21]
MLKMGSEELRPIPAFHNLSEIYNTEETLERERQRWSALVQSFVEEFGGQPNYIIRAPGRVNVLGEHIDYSLFPVLPAAIEQDIIVGIRPTATFPNKISVDLANAVKSYPNAELQLARDQELWSLKVPLPSKAKGWERYVVAVLLECLERFAEQLQDGAAGMEVMVSGTVPEGAGLSSSAAFVVGIIVAFLVANGLQEGVSRVQVVDIAMAAEHRLGLKSGGMDQAASILSVPNSLLHLSFYPSLKPAILPLPSSLTLVITNSMAPHSLADSAPDRYNLRVVENLCATRILLHTFGADAGVLSTTQRGSTGRLWLREALEHWAEDAHMDEETVYRNLLARIVGVLGKEGRDKNGWTKNQMIEESGMTAEDFEATFLAFIPIRATRFYLLQRVQHTLEESLRVCSFKRLCEASVATSDNRVSETGLVKELGALITASHVSMRDLYEATVPEVDDLQALCLQCGSLGSRQTGGGWGGAVISLLPSNRASDFLREVRKMYSLYRGLSVDELDKAAFITVPGSGAGFYPLMEGCKIV